MIRNPVFIFIVLVLLCSAAHSEPKPTAAIILCYPTDKVISSACKEIERRLSECESSKVKVIRKDNLNPMDLKSTLVGENIPAHTPVFIVGHGASDYDHNHFMAAKHFWKDHPEKVKPEAFPRLVDEGKLISGKTLNNEISKVLNQPAVWYLSCHSGGNCTEGGNIGASCSSWETSSISQISSTFKLNLKQDPATRRIISLICSPGEFEKADHDSNGFIERIEWLSVFNSGLEKSVTLPKGPITSEGKTETQEKIKKQLSPGSIISESKEAIDLTLKNCVNSGAFLDEAILASPVLSHFSLPHWRLQGQASQQALPKPTQGNH